MDAPPRDPLAASLQHYGLARDRMRAALARRAGFTATDLDALEHLEADGPLTQRELGDRLALTSGAITMLADRLEHGGWLRRRPHPSDRRYLLLELAPGALERAPAALGSFHSSIAQLVADVPAEHRENIQAFLESVADVAATTARELAASGPPRPRAPRPPVSERPRAPTRSA